MVVPKWKGQTWWVRIEEEQRGRLDLGTAHNVFSYMDNEADRDLGGALMVVVYMQGSKHTLPGEKEKGKE